MYIIVQCKQGVKGGIGIDILYLSSLNDLFSIALYKTIRDYLRVIKGWDVYTVDSGNKPRRVDVIIVEGDAVSAIPRNIKDVPIVTINVRFGKRPPIWRVCALQVNVREKIPRFEGAMPGNCIAAAGILEDDFNGVLERITGYIPYWLYVYGPVNRANLISFLYK